MAERTSIDGIVGSLQGLFVDPVSYRFRTVPIPIALEMSPFRATGVRAAEAEPTRP
jgi:hypothetical protein